MLLPVDNTSEASELARIDAAAPPGVLTDAQGRPASSNHPILQRNPAFSLHSASVIVLPAGRFLRVADTTLTKLPAKVRASAVPDLTATPLAESDVVAAAPSAEVAPGVAE